MFSLPFSSHHAPNQAIVLNNHHSDNHHSGDHHSGNHHHGVVAHLFLYIDYLSIAIDFVTWL
jgi:hypothetical protein